MGKPNTTLGIEVGDSSLKLALFDQKHRKVIRLGVVDTSSHPLREVDFLEKTIAQWVDGYPEMKSSSIVLSIPARLGVVRRVQIPAAVPNPHEYVEWEFSTAVNSPRSEYYLDYHEVGGSSSHGGKTAVVGAIRRIWLDTMRRGFQHRELVPGVVEIDAFSLLNLLEVGIVGPKGGVFCVVKVDRTGVIVAWGQNGSLLALRWVSVSALSSMGREDAFRTLAEGLTAELRKGFTQVGVDQSSGQIVHLCGDLSVESDFVDALRKSSPDFLYHLLDSFHRIQLDADGATTSKAPLCATAIGAALRFREDRK